ncbi:hypothetical protein AVEN_93762-1 [Araneus ventricosus]|uniref:Uncharacterized protein n=1 Tax=Araneus ventricosus TaxID=182803 RepID=A0A4Y2NZF1_ARAVE|nr:hypothetical protein AVEN_49041-1 [Araneus ventricosus]GBN44153.1 hypothetical protein AVEN_93762-1 [Araneus ventricosus]
MNHCVVSLVNRNVEYFSYCFVASNVSPHLILVDFIQAIFSTGHLRARRPVACISLTPNHCRLRREWYQARAQWRTEWRSVVFPDESRLCLGASDGRVLVGRRQGERLQPTCLWPIYTGPTPGVMVS